MKRTQKTEYGGDPRFVQVQLQVRVPWWRREQLTRIAVQNNTKIPALIADALDRMYPGEPPSPYARRSTEDVAG